MRVNLDTRSSSPLVSSETRADIRANLTLFEDSTSVFFVGFGVFIR